MAVEPNVEKPTKFPADCFAKVENTTDSPSPLRHG
jgi:hypothetical protein